MIQNEKMPCPFCRESRASKIRTNGTYPVKNPVYVDVQRYICKSCGESYTQLTRAPEDSYGSTKIKSHYSQKIEDALFQKIEDFIIEKGFLRISQIKAELKIGVGTYYRYMKTLRQRFFWQNNIDQVRKLSAMSRMILLEAKTKITPEKKEGKKRRSTIRIFILFDKETHLAYEFFLIVKKKRRSSHYDFGKHYTMPELISYLKQLKNNHQNLVIEADCEKLMKAYLLKKASDLFNPSARYFASFWKDLEKYRIRKILNFGWTITEKKSKRREDALAEELGQENASMVWNPISPMQNLHDNLSLLLSIYNKHHLVRLSKSK